MRDGLISNQIRGLHQDSLGYMWIATWDGLSRLDGHVFRNYNTDNGLKHNVINDIISITPQEIYVAENDGTIDVIRSGLVDSLSSKTGVVVNQFYLSMNRDILATTDHNGICHMQTDGSASIKCGKITHSIKQFFRFGEYYAVIGILGSHSGILDNNQKYIRQWELPGTEFFSLLGDTENRIWIGTSDGLYYLNIADSIDPLALNPARTIYPNLPADHAQVNVILQSKNKELWFGTNTGLLRLKLDGSVRQYNRSNGLINSEITCLYEDKSHVLWIGTEQGVSKMDLQTTIEVHTFEKTQGSSATAIVGMNKDGDILCIDDYSTVYQINQGIPQQQFQVEIPGMKLYGITKTTDQNLITTSMGLVELDGRPSVWKFPPQYPRTAYVLWADSLVYYIFNQAIASCDQKDCMLDSTGFEVLVTTLHPDGRIFIGTWGGGLFCGRPQKGRRTFLWEDWSAQLPEKTVRSLFIDSRENLWIGTRYSGVVCMTTDDQTHKAVNYFNQKNGLMSDWISVVQEDAQGNIWIGSHSGLDKLVRDTLGYEVYPFSRLFELYTVINSIAADKNGDLWCGTKSGLVHIIDGRPEKDQEIIVRLTRAKIGSFDLCDPQGNRPISMPYNKNLATFEFASPNYFNSRQIEYQYRLIGSTDTSWSHHANSHQVTYANLRPGKYLFEVRPLSWNLQKYQNATLAFWIQAPFWERPWFILLLFVVCLSAFYFFYKFRINQLRRIHVLRQRIATDLHDNIGSSLTHVNILAQLGKTGLSNNTDHLFHRIGEEVQSSSEALDDIIWSTQSDNDALEDLIARMQRYGAELFDPQVTTFGIETVGLGDHLVLDMELRGDLYLIYKELLRNVVKHAQAGDVRVLLGKQDHGIYLHVTDNGIGFDQQKPTARNGLANIRRRAEKWQGHLQIKSSKNRGTDIKVTLRKRKST
jgi:ligand-binding sensor domain-containing protein/two-component sensor histidine kinase